MYSLHQTLEQFLRAKRATGKSDRTLVWYECLLVRWVRWLNAKPADWLAPEALEEYLTHMRKDKLSDNTIDGFWKALKVFFVWIKRRRPALLKGQTPPVELVDRPRCAVKMPRIASYEDVCTLITAIKPTRWLDYRNRAIIQTMLSTGLRVNEVTNLRVQDIDQEEKFVFVNGGKGNKDRFVPYDDDCHALLAQWLIHRPTDAGDWMFVGSDWPGHPTGQMTTNAVRKFLECQCNAIGAKVITPHSLRHLFATKALNDGVPLSAVSAALGHTSVAFTAKVYAKWHKSGLRDQFDRHWRKRPV